MSTYEVKSPKMEYEADDQEFTWYDQAKERVEDSEKLSEWSDFILADRNEGDDHYRWVAQESEDEIINWCEACNR